MRFSLAIAALPALTLAQNAGEGTFAQYKAQFQNFLGKFGSYVPETPPSNPVAAAEAKIGSIKTFGLTLDNWRETLYAPVKPTTKVPEEWWVFITGRNKTCFGHCEKAERAFNETAGKFALLPKAPHTAILNCEDQPVLCNSWSASTGSIWSFHMLPPPGPIEIYTSRLNLTSVTSEDIIAKWNRGEKKGFTLYESFFHPFDGKAAEYGVAVPIGYALWAFNLVPQWAFMIIVSMVSRSFMSNRFQGQNRQAAGAQPPAQ